ncbi:MAG TPA: glycoside hydrolase family 3 C-terminal domain-containing protein, partial [Prolixibacteraceae bacterium]|nr:glycoside hydrolase family 3 C-terminal domain-containing protein [Prolixibacteraceae bacterium]
GNHPKYMKLVATAKHFAVHNGPEPERHSFNAVPNARDLWETYLPAFYDLVVEGKAYSVMGAYNRVDGESASASWMLLEDILRNKWNFDGYVVSDCGAIRDIHAFHKIVNTPEESAAVGVRRGCDLNCGSVYQMWLRKAVETGLISEGEINQAVYRLMLARLKLGMFDPPEMVPYAQIPYDVNNSKPHDDMALKMAQKSMTLLKNNGILPLNHNKLKTIAIVGPNANSVVALRANYHGDASDPVTVLDGVKNAASNHIEILYNEGCPLVDYDGDPMQHDPVDEKYLSSIDENGNRISGLKGEYFNNNGLKGEPDFIRIDEKINMNWADQSPVETELAQGLITPEEQINKNNFSVRWTGQLQSPGNGEYTFGMISDDGCRVYIDGELIIDEWTEHAMAPSLTTFNFEEGKTYNIKIEYFDSAQDAGAILVWKKKEDKEAKQQNGFNPSPEMLANVKNADVAIFVGGLDATWEGEEMRNRSGIEGFDRGDRTSIELPPVQQKTLNAMLDTETPVVMVMMAGSAIALNGLEKELPAILMGWYPGQRGGDAIADVLFGHYNPAGKLPVTFYTSTNELAAFRDYNMNAGKGFTYRYYKGEPLFPFGHGLSYTTFEYSDMQINKSKICNTDSINVSVNITNTGGMHGEEVVQLYVKDVDSDKTMPVKQLRNFKRIALNKGETKTVSFTLKAMEDLRYFDAMYERYMVDPGDFEIQIGSSSKDIRKMKVITVE